MRAVLVLAFCAIALAGCSPQETAVSDYQEAAVSEPYTSPPPPPPFVDCSYTEHLTARQALINYVASQDSCVMNRGQMTASLTNCQHETSSGYAHASGAVTFGDTFTDVTYLISLNAIVAPAGGILQSNVSGVNSEYNSACTMKGILDWASEQNAR